MRVLLAVLALTATLSACSVGPRAETGPRRDTRLLRAHISPPETGGLGFYVSRPAYVALFEIVPGRGTSLLYPGAGYGPMDGHSFAGLHHLGWVRRTNVEQYLPAFGTSRIGGPRYYFLIASERPLELDRFGSYGWGLRSAMGMHFASYGPYNAMEELARMTLPSLAPDGSWTTDVYVHWPNVLYTQPGDRRVRVACNGYVMYVPVQHVHQVQRTICAPQEAPARDSTAAGTKEPRRRAPVPAVATDLRDRVTSSRQLEEGRARPTLERRGWATDEAPTDEAPRTRKAPRASEPASPRRERPSPPPRRAEPRRAEPRGVDTRRAAPEPKARPAPRESSGSGASRAPAAPRSRPTPEGKGERCNPCEPV